MYNLFIILVDSLGDMNKKNILNQRDSGNKKSNKSDWKNLTTGVVMLASVLSITPSYSQTTKTHNNQKKDSIELVESKDTINYEEMKTSPIKRIIKHYTKEQIREIVANCILIEFNKIRAENWLPPLIFDASLMECAQSYAEAMEKTKKFSHTWSNGKKYDWRAKKAWYKWNYVRENIGYNYYSIEEAIKEQKQSPIHFETITDPRLTKLWVYLCGSYWDFVFGGE